MKKNPFSIYDFLGYVFPGAFAICLFRYIYISNGTLKVMSFIESMLSNNDYYNWEDTVIFIILSYIAGHVIAYASSLTIEPFSVWKYGYPSAFLLGKTRYYYGNSSDDKSKWRTACIYFFKTIVALFLLPILLFTLLLGDLLCLKYYYVKKLDNYLCECINCKIKLLVQRLQLPSLEDFDNVDFHRIIYHYAYENSNNHIIKMDNYVALYGFMRSLCFIFNCATIYFIYIVITNNMLFSNYWFLLLSMSIISYFFFMAFIKFYRRFTLEALMCLISNDKIDYED